MYFRLVSKDIQGNINFDIRLMSYQLCTHWYKALTESSDTKPITIHTITVGNNQSVMCINVQQ